MKPTVTLPAEWAPQTAVQLTWPHEGTDWAPMLDEITQTYVAMARAIVRHERLLIVAPDVEHVRRLLDGQLPLENVSFHQCPTDDTWARDHGFLTLSDGTLLDFRFNGWGCKFPADNDNAINRSLAIAHTEWAYESHDDFVLEGGSIESDGRGTILTTTGCLLAPNRNQPLTKEELEEQLKRRLRAQRVLWIDYGHLAGDDTDGHIDTLVRIAPDDTLLYVCTRDEEDEHYEDLLAMETQLHELRTTEGQPYRLLPLPLPNAIYDEEGMRLPATYANYLVLNDAVLVPTYAQPDLDEKAVCTIAKAFPGREMIPIDSRAIIKQHGSIHCCTMQFPLINEE